MKINLNKLSRNAHVFFLVILFCNYSYVNSKGEENSGRFICKNFKNIEPDNNVRNRNVEYEQPFEQGNKLFNIGDNNYALTSSKDIAKGKTTVLKTTNGIVCLSANGKGGIKIVAKQIDISKDVYAYNDNFNLIDQFGMLDDADYIQLSNVDLDGDGEKELVVTIGAPHTGLGIVSFIFTSELKYAGKVDGWDYMFLNRHRHIIAPHSALRWYDYYCYRHGEIKSLGEVNIDTSQQPHVNQKKAENRLYNELRNTK